MQKMYKIKISICEFHLQFIYTFNNSDMEFIICQKHSKIQKAPHKVTTNTYVCMNRYCQESFLTLCSICKNDHRDHSNKILTLEDITFLIQRLLKSPFKELTFYIDEAVSAMKKFKLIQENKRKIEILEKEIYKQVMGLVDFTQTLIHEYAVCKKTVNQLSQTLVNIETPDVFEQFRKSSNQFLSNLEYNFQKDKLEYGNQVIRQKYENRRKSYEKTKRKLEQVKDYSMKIIEVILANQDSDDQQEDIIYKKKMYEILKRQLEQSSFKQILKDARHLQKQSKQSAKDNTQQEQNQNHNHTNDYSYNGTGSMISQDKKSKTTTPGILSSKSQSVLSIQKSCQTSSQWIKLVQESNKQSELKIKKLELSNAKSLNQLQNKISMLVKQKESIKKQFSQLEHKQKAKNQMILEIQLKLRENKKKRKQKESQKQNKLQKLIEIANWKGILEGDKVD